jgi:hypothetical protein
MGNITITSEAHIDWDYDGKRTDPNVVPSHPTGEYKVLKIGDSLDLDLELRTGLEGEWSSVSGSFQVVAFNWPGYSA